MTMAFNKDVFKLLAGGSQPSSPVSGIASGLSGDAASLKSQLSALNVDGLDSVISQVDSAEHQLTGFSGHAADQTANVLANTDMARSAREITSFVDDLPPSCGDTNTLMGSILGAADDTLNAAGSALADMQDAVNRFLAGTLSETELKNLLASLAVASTIPPAGSVTGSTWRAAC